MNRLLLLTLVLAHYDALKLSDSYVSGVLHSLTTSTNQVDGSNTYDYIIVGGGTAGCILANRLSEDKDKKVLVVEAGSSNYNNKYMKIPSGVRNLFKSKYDWDFASAKETASGDREIYLCRGKVLGGSSCTNVLLYNRGDSYDYKKWEIATGSDEWSPENILPYFKKSENQINGESMYHGNKGEFYVSDVKYQNPMSKAFLNACDEYGMLPNKDFNDWSLPQTGFGRFQVTQNNGERCSAASGFLTPILNKRKNLKIKSKSIVRRLLFSDSNSNSNSNSDSNVITKPTVIGIEIEKLKHGRPTGIIEKMYLSKSQTGTYENDSEIILCGGSINTPQILMLSGVGDKNTLEKYDIPIVLEHPSVGKNLMDHPGALVSFACCPGNEGVALSSQVRIKGTLIPNPKALLQWMLFKSGPLTSTSCDHGLFYKTSLTSSSSSSSADLQIRFITAKAITADGMSTLVDFKKLKALGDGFTFQNIAVRPCSVGSVTLSSSNPHDKPLISTGYLTQEEDISVLVEGIKLSRELSKMKSLSKYLGEEVFPGKHVQSDEDIKQYIRSSVHTTNALVGTCKMGREDDPSAVVTPDLKVKGINKLRIVDASIMPFIPGGQTSAAVVMIAEKASHFILKK